MKNRFPQFPGINSDERISHIESLREIAEEKGITVPQLLTSWVLSQGEDIMPLIGARTVSQLRESLKSFDAGLSKSDLGRIEKAVPADAAAYGGFAMKFKNGMIVH
jgi:aryl-alcohol dehydrogenase-like predicted oxidoreductase